MNTYTKFVAGAWLCVFSSFSQAMPSDLNSTVLALTANYNNVVENCGSAGRPAFLCSGVIIRVTKASPNYHAWDPSPLAKKRGGVSFSYLRKDIPFDRLAGSSGSGIIYYPSMSKPEGKGRAEVLCSFPSDGYTDTRPSKAGCGPNIAYPKNSDDCQTMGIQDAAAWYKNFYQGVTGRERYKHQCAFNVDIKTPNSAVAFRESIKAQQLLKKDKPDLPWNELIIKTWETDVKGITIEAEKLPIQAFFYTFGKTNSLSDARFYQRDYYETTRIMIPIVGITLPKDGTDAIQFYYNEMDQHHVNCSIID
ncbi:N-acyl homoserine lactonase [Serratia fonticola]|uniref:N-acyl homoserine lactonase n=1 Tax=Serratia fonticola TaxID=47917 RepID=UPI0024DE916F|nr:N-acyl homoserine lactonase [Serratia fonticola]MDK2374860.1 N-acyl homoserine lactonase [Serratia fonticola]